MKYAVQNMFSLEWRATDGSWVKEEHDIRIRLFENKKDAEEYCKQHVPLSGCVRPAGKGIER